MFCLLVVLAMLSVLAKWLARKTPMKKPNRGKVIVFRKPLPKSEFHGLYIMCLSLLTYMIYFPNAMARCTLFVLKVPSNTKQTNKPPCSAARLQTLKISPVGDWRLTSLEWPWPWPSFRPYGIQSCIIHRPLPTYQISLRSEENFFWKSPLRFWSSSESRDTKTRTNIKNPAQSNLDIVL